MKTTYILFEAPKNEQQYSDGFVDGLFFPLPSIVSLFTKSNRTKKIDDVKWWLVELDCETGIPQREIGLDKQGRTILKMPFENNYGYGQTIIYYLMTSKRVSLFLKFLKVVLMRNGHYLINHKLMILKEETAWI